MSRIEETVGGVDILVHNARVAPDLGPGLFLDYPEATLRGQLELKTVAAATVFRRALPGQIERGWGRLIQISSGVSATGLGIGVSAYGASKAATEALVRHTAVEYGSTGVTANSLALGLMDNVVADGPLPQTMVDSIPRRVLGQPDEVGAAVVWLASELGSVVTGQVRASVLGPASRRRTARRLRPTPTPARAATVSVAYRTPCAEPHSPTRYLARSRRVRSRSIDTGCPSSLPIDAQFASVRYGRTNAGVPRSNMRVSPRSPASTVSHPR